VGLVEEVRFTAFAIQVCVRAEERRECADPIPTHEHLRLRIAEEAANVSYVSYCMSARQRAEAVGGREKKGKGTLTSGKTHARNTVREDHLDANGHVFPGAEVVTCPHCAIALRASKEGARKYERSLGRLASRDEAFRGDLRKEHAVDIVDVAVLPATIVDKIFWHGNFGSVEN